MNHEIYDVIIIGAGPAGMTGAIYAGRACLKTLVIETKPMAGGQIADTYEVDNYPGIPGISGMELGSRFEEHAKKLGSQMICDEITHMEKRDDGLFYLKGYEGDYLSRTLLLAAGARHRRLEIPGEEEFEGNGVSFCATCDGAFYKDKTVAVIGGGDAALEDAIFLSRICTKVYLIHRRDSLRGAKSLQEKVFAAENIEVLFSRIPEEIAGDEYVERLYVSDAVTGEEHELCVDGVFEAIGILANNELLKNQVRLDGNGYVEAGEDCKTSMPGLFVAGDLRSKRLRQVITACADGANAVTSIEEYLIQG